jgi:hypothetical protein
MWGCCYTLDEAQKWPGHQVLGENVGKQISQGSVPQSHAILLAFYVVSRLPFCMVTWSHLWVGKGSPGTPSISTKEVSRFVSYLAGATIENSFVNINILLIGRPVEEEYGN